MLLPHPDTLTARKRRLLHAAIFTEFFPANPHIAVPWFYRRFADGLMSREAFNDWLVRLMSKCVVEFHEFHDLFWYPSLMAESKAWSAVAFAFDRFPASRPYLDCHLRDGVGLDPDWLRRNDSAVLHVARSMYEDYSEPFSMGILGDALEDGGCTDADILDHCRDANVRHWHGCWVVDLLLGK